MYEEAREGYAADLAYAHDLTLPQGRELADLAVHYLDRNGEMRRTVVRGLTAGIPAEGIPLRMSSRSSSTE